MACSQSSGNNLQPETDQYWMRQALELAQKAGTQGEVPVGAVIIDADQRVAEGWNQVIQRRDPSAHAEIVALRAAGQTLENYRLPGTTLYVTLEPCCMCAGALIHARVKRVVYATPDPKTGAAGSRFDVLISQQHNHQVEVSSGVLQQEAEDLLRGFFKAKRCKPISADP